MQEMALLEAEKLRWILVLIRLDALVHIDLAVRNLALRRHIKKIVLTIKCLFYERKLMAQFGTMMQEHISHG